MKFVLKKILIWKKLEFIIQFHWIDWILTAFAITWVNQSFFSINVWIANAIKCDLKNALMNNICLIKIRKISTFENLISEISLFLSLFFFLWFFVFSFFERFIFFVLIVFFHFFFIVFYWLRFSRFSSSCDLFRAIQRR